MKDKIEIKIKNSTYELDVDEAIYRGILKKKHIEITDVKSGDVFGNAEHADNLFVLELHTLCYQNEESVFSWFGSGGGIRAFSTSGVAKDPKFATKKETLNFLNDNKYEKIGNIAADITKAFNSLRPV